MNRLASWISSGRVTHAYQSELGSSHSAAGVVGHPISTWNPAVAVPNWNVAGKLKSSGAPVGPPHPATTSEATSAAREVCIPHSYYLPAAQGNRGGPAARRAQRALAGPQGG